MLKRIFNKSKNKYFINTETLDIYSESEKTNKLLKIKWKNGKYGLCVPLQIYYDKETGRNRTRDTHFNYIIGRYILNFNESNYILEYNNDNYSNFKVKYINEYSSQWKKIKNCDFLISSNGLLYDMEKCIFRKPIRDKTGYFYYSFNKNKYKRSILVWETFNDKKVPKDYIIDHIDNICYNDNIDNLQCITKRENIVKEQHRELPTGVSKDKNKYKAYITYTINNKIYESIYLGTYNNVDDASKAYCKAVDMVNNNINPIKYGDNKEIKYSFSSDTWYFKLPQMKGCDKIYKGYKTYEEANNAYYKYKVIDVENETEEEKILRKGYFSFKYCGNTYQIYNNKTTSNAFIETYHAYKNARKTQTMNSFISKLDSYKQKILQEDKDIKTKIQKEKDKAKQKYKENKEKEKITRYIAYKEKQRDFVYKENYTKNTYNDNYTFNIPYSDGKRYYIGSFSNPEIVKELDDIFNEHKFKDDFIEWVNVFKENDLVKYKERDKSYRSLKFNQVLGYKGYKWFAPRNCWRVIKRMNNKEYLLGYYKNENSCKAILNEANQMIELGKFEQWYKDIECHKNRIKTLFSENKAK